MTTKIVNSENQDVKNFHEKFGHLSFDTIGHLTPRKALERIACMHEEINEFTNAVVQDDMEGMADALIDLMYFAHGTAAMMGLPIQELWDDVHRANMAKERGIGKRGHLVDAIKPEGWQGPKTGEILAAHGYDKNNKGEYRDDQEHL